MLHNQSFKLDDLLKTNKTFQVDKNPMWLFLENMDRKLAEKGGLSNVPIKEVLEAVYEYGVITVGLDKADLEQRLENLTEQNILWFSKAQDLEKENERLRLLLQEKQSSSET